MHAHPLEARMAHVEGAFNQVNERLGSIDRRLDSMDSRFAGLDHRLDAMDVRFNWVIGTIVAAWTTMIATQIGTTLALLFHH